MSGARGWQVHLSRRAQKDIARLDPPVKRRILDALVELETDPRHARGVRKLVGRPEVRLRIGDWRVIFEINYEGREVQIIRVLPRGRAYER